MNERLVGILADSFFRILMPGLTVTIPLTVLSFAFAMVIAVALALVQFAGIRGVKELARFYVWVIRGTPLLVQLYVIVFSMNQGAYCSEILRGALEAVPKGQMEAGYCVGMSYLQIMRRIVLPQAFRIAFSSLSNSLISMVKDTSLAANITVAEMFMAAQRIVARTYESLALYLEVGMIYLLFCTILTRLQREGEKRLALEGKR